MAGAPSLPEFGNFDDRDVYEKCHRAAVQGDTKNFVIEFDSTKAHAAYDLGGASIEQLLQLEVNDSAYHIHAIKEDAGYLCNPGKKWTLTFTKLSEQSIRVRDGCMSTLPLQYYSIRTDWASSNIWAPERQKDVVSVRSNRPTALCLIDFLSRHWPNITAFRLGSVVSCVPIMLRVSQYHPRPIAVVSSRKAGNRTWNVDQWSHNRSILRRREWPFPPPLLHLLLT